MIEKAQRGKVENRGTTYYIASGPNVFAEYDGSGNLEAEYIDGLYGLLMKKDSEVQEHYYLKDHPAGAGQVSGNNRQMSGENMRRDFYPYGEAFIASGDGTNYLFTGKPLDEGTGLYYFGARYYDPGIGRWYVPDPAGQYFSPYVYCGSSPVVLTDDDGSFAQSIPVIISAYKIYTTARTAYHIYNSWKEGGFGAAFSAFVRGTISYGASEIAGGYTSGIIPEGDTFIEDALTQLGNTAIETGARKTASAFASGEDIKKFPSIFLNGAYQGAKWSVAEQLLFGTYRGWDDISDKEIKDAEKELTMEEETLKKIYGGYTQGGVLSWIMRGFKNTAQERYGYFNLPWSYKGKINGKIWVSSSLIIEEFGHYMQMRRFTWPVYALTFPITDVILNRYGSGPYEKSYYEYAKNWRKYYDSY